MAGLQVSDILLHIINIFILYYLLRSVLWKPVSRFLADRAARIERERKDAESMLEEAQKQKDLYDQHMKTFEEEGQAVLRESRRQAIEQADEIVVDARTRAEKMLVDARARIGSEKKKAVDEVRSDAALLAVEIASRILRREVSVSDNEAAADDFFDDAR